MASILFCWELGAGYGHLTPHREVLARLREKGHSVHIAVRDLTRAAKAFDGLPFHYWQAPTPQSRPDTTFNPTVNFAQILHNTGLGDPTGLAARISAWRNIFAVTRPRVALVDYCPTALLALRGLGIPAIVTGTGFFIPPNVSPFPPFAMVAHLLTPEKLAEEEAQLLKGINAAIAVHQLAPLTSLAQIFHEVAGKIFRSLPEFDHYPNRGPAEFLGLPPDPPRAKGTWPAGDGPRVFAYLKPFQTLETLLTQLQQRGYPTIVACDGITKAHRHKFTSQTLRFVPPTIDIPQMGRESHFAITNANLTTSVRLLVQGCPLMAIPLQLEQTLVANNFQRLGLGVTVRPNMVEDIAPQLDQLVQNPQYRAAAQALAAKYAGRANDYVDRATAVLEPFLVAPSAKA
ncbi:MAG: hypothetical protein JSS49_10030 [Planctomycetes bacterium]|nr:hypothetical protein [Planctomycetota bacterium]